MDGETTMRGEQTFHGESGPDFEEEVTACEARPWFADAAVTLDAAPVAWADPEDVTVVRAR